MPQMKMRPARIPGQHNPKECSHVLDGKFIHYTPKRATEGKEIVRLYEEDGARELIVPKRDPIDIPGILPRSEFERLKRRAKVLTEEERQKILEEKEANKDRLQKESDDRKRQLMMARRRKVLENDNDDHDDDRKGTTKLDKIENEATKRNMYLLRRSQELMMEQDDRVKKANAIILAAKCRAIRNAQIVEKKLVDRQLREEEMRLDTMMEQQRQKQIEIEEKKREENEKKKQRYVAEVKQQIEENEMTRLLEAERVEEESKTINKALIELEKEAEEKEKEKERRQSMMRKEFRKSNREAEHYRLLREEEGRIADLRVQEFMRRKAEREEKAEKEAAMAKTAKEREIGRLRGQQQKAKDLQAAMDEINALRRQEEKEKEWRESEKKAALKRLELNRDLREARQRQIDDIRKTQAKALARDEEDFIKVVKVQRELYEKEAEEQKKRKEAKARHRKELLKQIEEKEKERIGWQSEKFEEGHAQRLVYQVKDRQVEDYLKEKIGRLKETNIPEQYISDIERQLKL